MKKIISLNVLLVFLFCFLAGCGRDYVPNAPLSASATPVPTCIKEAYIPDVNLRQAMLSGAGKNSCAACKVCEEDLPKIQYLNLNNVVDYTGLTLCVNVSSVGVYGLKTAQAISTLQYLPLLEGLSIQNDGLINNDISGLSSLTSLTHLSIDNNSISDLSPLSGLTSLTYIGATNCNIGSLAPLSGLIKLQTLYVTGNVLHDLNGLQALTNLQYLFAGTNNINDISAISALTNLRYLALSSNNITDISAVSSLTAMEYFYADSNNISDLSPLKGDIGLTYLALSYNQIADISALTMNAAAGGLGNGDTINLHGNILNSTPDADTYIPYLKSRGVNVTYP
jgi:internalin A